MYPSGPPYATPYGAAHPQQWQPLPQLAAYRPPLSAYLPPAQRGNPTGAHGPRFVRWLAPEEWARGDAPAPVAAAPPSAAAAPPSAAVAPRPSQAPAPRVAPPRGGPKRGPKPVARSRVAPPPPREMSAAPKPKPVGFSSMFSSFADDVSATIKERRRPRHQRGGKGQKNVEPSWMDKMLDFFGLYNEEQQRELTNPQRPALSGNDDFDRVADACYTEVMRRFNECQERGEKYFDNEFVRDATGGDDTANDFLEELDRVDWKRLGEIGDAPELFVDGSEPGDIIQGRLGTCYLLSALSAMSVVPNLVERVFAAYDIYMGIYGVMLYNAAAEKWEYVIIDDFVPCSWGEPIHARCLDPDELWVSLLEKAAAKKGRNGVTNLYSAIASGRPEDPMVAFSGGSCDVLMRGYHAEFSYDYIARLIKDPSYLCSANSCDSDQGIYAGHSYAMLDAITLQDGTRLLQLRNPWGNTEWEGRYGDESPEMTPDLRITLGHTSADDGTFFICWEDFLRLFADISVLTLPAALRG